MSAASKIEWTEATWNFATGCTKVSPGCEHCYIDRTPPFRMEGRRFTFHRHEPTCQPSDRVGATTGVRLHPERLDLPSRWRKPRRVFVCSLSDPFHADIPDEMLVDAFDVMANNRRHTFQLLTKRPARMRSFMRRYVTGEFGDRDAPPVGVLPNVIAMVTAEDQKQADLRIPILLDTPAAIRGVSVEPMLGPIDLLQVRGLDRGFGHDGRHHGIGTMECPSDLHHHHDERCDFPLSWVIVGGESGPGARPMDTDWARSIVTQCQAAGVPVFVKQMGSRFDAGLRPGAHKNINLFPAALQVRQYPEVTP